MRLLDADDLEAKGLKYSAAHRWRLIKAGKFPKPIKLGQGGRNAWLEEEVDRHIAERIAERDYALAEAV
jgi:prophage regulatory protein